MSAAGAALAVLLLAAAAQYAWNAFAVAPLAGYDATAHAGYFVSIVREGRVPHPLEGWQTFHPPLYYLVASVVWRTLEPLGAVPLIVGLRAIGALPWLGAGWVASRLARRLGATPEAAGVAAALFWLVPCNQLAAVMVGNEAASAALATFALPFVLTLQEDPRDLRAALGAGLLAGLAFATKYSGLWIAAACAVPFLRGGLDGRALRALAVCLVAGVVVAGPVYVRNLALTGSPFPMTREQEPLKSAEAILTPRPRQLTDYVRLDPDSVLRPSIFHRPGRPGHYASRNPAMANVWGLAYAGAWYDPFGQRVPIESHRDGVWWGTALLLLGLVPTALMLAGFARATANTVRSRGRSREAPLVLMMWLALASFVAFTWRVPTWAAVKASYFLPVAAPAVIFFAQSVGQLGAVLRRAALAVSLLAALGAGLVFTERVVFTLDPTATLVPAWRYYAAQLPEGYLDEALRTFYGEP